MVVEQYCVIIEQFFQNDISISIASYLNSSFKQYSYSNQSINISQTSKQMQLVQKIDKQLSQTLPYYTEVSAFTTQQCRQTFNTFNNLYLCSTTKVQKLRKTSRQFKKDVEWMVLHTTDDFLEYLEQKFQIECAQVDEKNRTKRIKNILDRIKEQYLMTYVNQLVALNKNLLTKGKVYNEKYVQPIYIKAKATLMVTKQMLLEIFAERVCQLKMTYQCSRDTITMFWSGEFKEEKVLAKIKQNVGNFKQFTVSFVQKGMEIKISRNDLIENYHHIMTMLAEVMKVVSEKSLQQWTQTKTKTVNLYNTVLNRIKDKQIQIKVKMIKITPEIKVEKSEQPKKQQRIQAPQVQQQ